MATLERSFSIAKLPVHQIQRFSLSFSLVSETRCQTKVQRAEMHVDISRFNETPNILSDRLHWPFSDESKTEVGMKAEKPVDTPTVQRDRTWTVRHSIDAFVIAEDFLQNLSVVR